MSPTATVTIAITGGPTATVDWQENLTGLMALQEAYAQLAPTQPFTYALQYYGASLGYLVVMINETYDSFISKGGKASTPFFYWEILVNGKEAKAGVDALLLSPEDVLSFSFVTYDAAQHGTTSVGAKHAFAYNRQAA